MKPSHTQLTCRAHNRFSPSVVLWQHFVGTDRPLLHHRRLASTAAEDTRDGSLRNRHASDALSQLGADSGQQKVRQVHATKLKIRRTRVSNNKGTWHETKTSASVHKSLQVKQEANLESQTEPDKLLAIARAAYDAGKDYVGVVVQPMKSATPGRETSLPWCLQANERTMPGIDRLAIEIERFYDYAKPTHTETFARRHLIERVRDLVQRVLPEYVLEVFGSERTGLAGATSDIDFRLVTRQKFDDPATAKLPPTSMRRGRSLRDLHQLHWRGFSNNEDYDLVELRYARYPLISLQDRQSGLDVQVVLSNDTSLSRQFMKGYMEEYPHLRPLYFLVKTIFDVRGLSDVFKGGFGSYSLFMMVVASLRHAPHPRNDAAGGLINFLKFYRNLDTIKFGVSIEPVSLFDKKARHVLSDKAKAKIEAGSGKKLPPYMLCLRDPADETNDLGRRAVAIKHVQTTFKKICYDLDRDMAMNTRASLLGPLVGSSYLLNKERRDKLRAYGIMLTKQIKSSLADKARMVREREALEVENKQSTEEQEEARLVAEARDNEWQRKSDERNRKLQEEAERTATLEHGGAITSILGMPSVDYDAVAEQEQQDGRDLENWAKPAPDSPTHEANPEAEQRSINSILRSEDRDAPKAPG